MAASKSSMATRSKNTRKFFPTARTACLEKLPCAFCKRSVDNELVYGKFYAIGDIQCHYSCVCLSTNLRNRGESYEGLFGYLYSDMLEEIERSKEIICSYCGKGGATLNCDVYKCFNDFHFSCAKERHAVFTTCGRHNTFCEAHAPNHDTDKSLTLKRPTKPINKNNNVLNQPKKVNRDIDLEEQEYEEDISTILAESRSRNVRILKKTRKLDLAEHNYADNPESLLVARYSVNVDDARRKRLMMKRRPRKGSPGPHIVLNDNGTDKMVKEIKIGRKTKFVSQDRKKRVKPVNKPSHPDRRTRSVARKDEVVKDLSYEVLEREDDCNILVLKV